LSSKGAGGSDLRLEHRKHTKKQTKTSCALYEQQKSENFERESEDLTFTSNNFLDVDKMTSHP
jgi:hypothetical protein